MKKVLFSLICSAVIAAATPITGGSPDTSNPTIVDTGSIDYTTTSDTSNIGDTSTSGTNNTTFNTGFKTHLLLVTPNFAVLTPEPATVGLFGGSLLLFGASRLWSRRKRQGESS